MDTATPVVDYTSFDLRVPDIQYRSLLHRIKASGRVVMPQQGEEARCVVGHQMHFRLRDGFPLITERDLLTTTAGKPSQFALAIAELVAFLNGAQTLDEMRGYGCGWWSRWVTAEKCAKRGLPPGDLGPGSYGPAWRRFPTAEGQPFDQITHLLEQMRELPHLRTHFVSPWIPQYIGRGQGKQQRVVVAPCHGWLHTIINQDRRELTLHHFQRSADAPVGLVFNLIQYAALTMMLAQVLGLTAHELVYTISDAHIYAKQLPDVDDLLATEPHRFPTVTLDPTITDLFAFRPEHFIVADYYPQLPPRKIWTPV